MRLVLLRRRDAYIGEMEENRFSKKLGGGIDMIIKK